MHLFVLVSIIAGAAQGSTTLNPPGGHQEEGPPEVRLQCVNTHMYSDELYL